MCYPLFPSTTINKLQARSTPCVFLGYPLNHRGYKCLDLSSNKIITSRHLYFDESKFPFAKVHKPQPNTYDFLDSGFTPYTIHYLQKQSLSLTQPTINPTSPPELIPSPTAPPDDRIRPTSPLSPTPMIHTHQPTSPTQIQPTPIPPTVMSHQPPIEPRPVTRSQHGIYKPNPR